MNLNFYPNGFNPMSDTNNIYNPYATLLGLNGQEALKQFQQNAENKLQQLQGQFTNNLQQNNTQNQNVQQPYYLFCGNKTDWDEFLMLHYGMTEQAIFDDYKLFLQAKQELLEEQGKNKKDTMKDKLRNNTHDKSTVKSNVSPKFTKHNSKQWKPTTVSGINRRYTNTNTGDSSQRDNRPMEQQETKEG